MEIQKIEYDSIKEVLNKTNLLSCSKEYINFCQAYFGAEPCFIGIFQDQKLAAVLPLFKRREKGLIYLETAPKLYTEIFFLENINVNFNQVLTYIKRNFKYDILDISLYFTNDKRVKLEGFSHHTDVYITKINEVANSEEILKKIVKQKCRNQIRYAYKHNLKKEISPDLEKFYPLYLTTMNRLGAKPKPLKYFRQLIKSFRNKLCIIFAKKENRVIGANLFIIQNDYLLLMFNVSDKRYWKYCVNNFLYWETILDGLKKGVKKFDFGINAKRDSTQIHFKQGFGARPYPIYHLTKFGSLKGQWRFYKRRVLFLFKLLSKKIWN